ncbi:MAG: c-type cytochrome biogenesis protein CcmI [Sedimenticola sp.]|nr:c-type cytochrome biogenesis protein CcmI [Sedimenticola sp.]
MTLFWILTAAMILVSLAFIAPALLRSRQLEASDRDQQNVVIARERLSELQIEHAVGSLTDAEYEQAKLELEQALLIDLEGDATSEQVETSDGRGKGALVVALLFIAVATVTIYLTIGTPQMVDPEAMLAEQQSSEELPSVEEMMTALVERLKEHPEDAEGWYLLGRTYMAMQDYQKAAFAFDKLNQLVSDQPSIMLALADALAMSSGGNMQGRPAELIRKAIQLAPEDQTALWLAGMVEDQAGNYPIALTHWRHLKTLITDDAESIERVDSLIAGAERKLAASGASPVTAPVQETAAAVGKEITARITLADDLLNKVTPDESLFIYARAMQGPKMPLAAVRLKVSDLPATVKLSDSQAMVPGMNLSSFKQVVVGARISRSGNAIAASGDLLGEVSPVAVDGEGVVELVINAELP